jgi:hypothetical protein
MGPHPILMQALHEDRSRAVQTILTERQMRDDAASDLPDAVAARPDPVVWIIARIRQIFGVRVGVGSARV